MRRALVDATKSIPSCVKCGLTACRSAASRASEASGPSEGEGGESAATACWAFASGLQPASDPTGIGGVPVSEDLPKPSLLARNDEVIECEGEDED
jgi:hypothetical protein